MKLIKFTNYDSCNNLEKHFHESSLLWERDGELGADVPESPKTKKDIELNVKMASLKNFDKV